MIQAQMLTCPRLPLAANLYFKINKSKFFYGGELKDPTFQELALAGKNFNCRHVSHAQFMYVK